MTITEVNTNVLQITAGSAQAEAINANYQWLDCDDNYSVLVGETNQLFECPSSCYYNIAVLVTQNNCSDTSDCIVLNVLELESLNSEIISVYPNPASDRIFFNNLEQLQDIHSMKLIDYNGRIVSRKNEDFDRMDVQFVTDGIYFIQIEHSNGIQTIKITIQ